MSAHNDPETQASVTLPRFETTQELIEFLESAEPAAFQDFVTLRHLEREHGITITADGRVLRVSKRARLRDRITSAFGSPRKEEEHEEEEVPEPEEIEPHGEGLAKVADTLHRAGVKTVHYTVDVPTEAMGKWRRRYRARKLRRAEELVAWEQAEQERDRQEREAELQQRMRELQELRQPSPPAERVI